MTGSFEITDPAGPFMRMRRRDLVTPDFGAGRPTQFDGRLAGLAEYSAHSTTDLRAGKSSSEQPGDFVMAEVAKVAEPAGIEDQTSSFPVSQDLHAAVEDAMIPDIVGAVNAALELSECVFDHRQPGGPVIALESVETRTPTCCKAASDRLLPGAKDGHREASACLDRIGGSRTVSEGHHQYRRFETDRCHRADCHAARVVLSVVRGNHGDACR